MIYTQCDYDVGLDLNRCKQPLLLMLTGRPERQEKSNDHNSKPDVYLQLQCQRRDSRICTDRPILH